MMSLSKVPIGIDLGTTSSAVGVWRNGRVEIIPTPSFIAFTDEGRLVGNAAKSQVATNLKNTIWGFKALLGRSYDDPVVQEGMKHWPFKVVNVGGKPNVEVMVNGGTKTKRFTAEELTCILIMYLKHKAEEYICQGVTDAVITVPAGFNSFQVAATKKATELAGLKVLQLISDPTAVAVTYMERMRRSGGHLGEKKNVLIFHIGGGTTGVGVLTLEDGSVKVKGTHGNTNLGGRHVDNELVDHVGREFQTLYRMATGTDPRAIQRLRAASERAKLILSGGTSPVIINDVFFAGPEYGVIISGARFKTTCDDLFGKALKELVGQVLMDSQMGKSDIHEILLVGGSTRIPKIQEMLRGYFAGTKLNKCIYLDEAGVHGATIQAAILSGCMAPQMGLTPLMDVTPFAFGVETVGGVMTSLVKRGTTLPIKHTNTFTTTYDNQSAVIIAVYEGEKDIAKENILLGTFFISKIPPAPAGVPRIDITFDVDGSGILGVTAVEKSSSNEKRMNPVGSGLLTGRGQIAKLLMMNDSKVKGQNYQDVLASIRGSYQTLRGFCNNDKESREFFDKKMKELDLEKKRIEGILAPPDFPLAVASISEDLTDIDSGDDDDDQEQDGSPRAKKRKDQ